MTHTSTIREYGSTLYVGMTREKIAAELNAYISFTLKRRLKVSSKPHKAIEGLFYLVYMGVDSVKSTRVTSVGAR